MLCKPQHHARAAPGKIDPTARGMTAGGGSVRRVEGALADAVHEGSV